MMMRSLMPRIAVFLGIGLAVGLAGAALQWGQAQAAEPSAGPALRHQFINNLDAGKQPPDARGDVTIMFQAPLPSSPTILLQCTNPRYAVKVHGASTTGFTFAIYHTRDILDSPAGDPFNGEKAAQPVTDFKAAENIDIAWVAIAE
jgi:hypothetical protein